MCIDMCIDVCWNVLVETGFYECPTYLQGCLWLLNCCLNVLRHRGFGMLTDTCRVTLDSNGPQHSLGWGFGINSQSSAAIIAVAFFSPIKIIFFWPDTTCACCKMAWLEPSNSYQCHKSHIPSFRRQDRCGAGARLLGPSHRPCSARPCSARPCSSHIGHQ